MAQSNKQPKTMSSRLLTMKFMQRAAASPSSPSAPLEPPSKKQRLSNNSTGSTPSTQSTTPDARAVEEALATEEHKRAQALEREAADRGETKWYLSLKQPRRESAGSPLHIVSAGYSTLDATGSARERSEDDEEEGGPAGSKVAGRRSFGKFNRTIEKQQNPDYSSSGSSDLDDDDEDEDVDDDAGDDPTGAKALIAQSRKEAGEKARAERKAKRKAKKAEALHLAEERRKKQVKLNKLTSISANSGTSPGSSNITCHRCGNKGHMQRDCPQIRSRKR